MTQNTSRKQQIVETYLELGTEVGFNSVSLSMIAGRLGMNKASLFSHFKSFEDIKQSSCEFCRSCLQEASFNVDFKATDSRTLLKELFQDFIDVFTTKPLIWWCSMLSQLESTDQEAFSYSEELDHMICARITVALDYCNQRSWTDIKDTDFFASVLTASIRREITKEIKNEADFENLFSGLTKLCSKN